MHEYGIAQDIVRRTLEEALLQQATRVVAIEVKIGPRELASKEALAFCIDVASQGTIVEGARVHITEAEGEGIVLNSIELTEASDFK